MVVVSWNIHRCIGSDRRYRPERVASVLKLLNADIIGLQEVDSSLKTEGEIDQLTYLANALNMKSAMGPTLRRDYGAYGNAILTKYEISDWEEYDLSYRRFEPRGALALKIYDRDKDLHLRIVNTHLGLKYWERSFQIDRILGDILWGRSPSASSSPSLKDQTQGATDQVVMSDSPLEIVSSMPVAILLGDFNEWLPFTANHLRLERTLGKIPKIATFPSIWPRLYLDRIYLVGLTHTHRYFADTSSLAKQASDHLPLVAEFEFVQKSHGAKMG